jgi:cellulose synthase/poly-beta-1,6-N-acetylglucosamine synthase-like glycosyltransferase
MQTIETVTSLIFWVCVVLVVYAYLGYAALIWCLARWFGRRADDGLVEDPEHGPSISLVIAAYNEESVIEERVQNALQMEYPAARYEIVVASDGSTDATADIVRRHEGRGVRLIEFPYRRGKAAVLNSVFEELTSDIVILSDANTKFNDCAARKLVRWFADPRVGVVCGRLVLTDAHTHRNIDGTYWKYETFLKRCEGRLGALLGANGAIYAIRRDCYTPIPNDTIIDDFVIPLLAKLRTDCAIVYDADAVAWEETAPDFRSEFRRRARIGAGGFQSIGVLWHLLNPRHGWVAFTYCSHKILRWLCPLFLVGALVSNLLLWQEPLYQLTLLGQGLFYLVAAVGTWLPVSRLRAVRLLRLPAMFTGMNLALLVGLWRWLRGSQKPAWARTVRRAEVAPVNGTAP